MGWWGTQHFLPLCQSQLGGHEEPLGGEGGLGLPPWGRQQDLGSQLKTELSFVHPGMTESYLQPLVRTARAGRSGLGGLGWSRMVGRCGLGGRGRVMRSRVRSRRVRGRWGRLLTALLRAVPAPAVVASGGSSGGRLVGHAAALPIVPLPRRRARCSRRGTRGVLGTAIRETAFLILPAVPQSSPML